MILFSFVVLVLLVFFLFVSVFLFHVFVVDVVVVVASLEEMRFGIIFVVGGGSVDFLLFIVFLGSLCGECVVVSVNMFGRETPANIDFLQAKKI